MADDEKLWPDETEKDFIHFMLKEAVDGNASFQWDTVTTKFNKIYEKSYTQNQINGKYIRLRKRYVAFTYLIGCDYISYDARTNSFKGSKDAWARAKRVHSRCIDFKCKGLKHYRLLGQLFQAAAQTPSARQVNAANVDQDEQGSDPKGKRPARSDTNPSSSGTKRKAVSQKTVESDDLYSLARATNVLESLHFDNDTLFMSLTRLEDDAKRQIFMALREDKRRDYIKFLHRTQ